jgi:hypothetical protein
MHVKNFQHNSIHFDSQKSHRYEQINSFNTSIHSFIHSFGLFIRFSLHGEIDSLERQLDRMRADKMKSYSKNQSFLSQQFLELEEAKQMNIHVNNDYSYSLVLYEFIYSFYN